MGKILITGGAGFIGAHVARQLLARGDNVVVLDDFNNRYDPRLKEARIQNLFIGVPAPEIVRLDIREYDQLEVLFNQHQFTSVIHLAAWASVQTSITNPHIYTEVNVDGTVNILEAARKSGVNNIVFASSSSVYGGLQHLPFKETNTVSRPLSPYAATKVAGEILGATWHSLYQIPITCLRFFTVYGPWGRPEMALFTFAHAILTGQPVQLRGRQTRRDFTYIDDTVSGVLAALDNPQGYAIYNLGENDAVPLPRLITALERALNKKAQVVEVALPPGDIPATLADIQAARRDLGYTPRITIEKGVEKFVDWYLSWYVPNFEEQQEKIEVRR